MREIRLVLLLGCLCLATAAAAQPSAPLAEEVNWHATVAVPFLHNEIYSLSGGWYWPYPGAYGHPDVYTYRYDYIPYRPKSVTYIDGGWWKDPRGYRPLYRGPGIVMR